MMRVFAYCAKSFRGSVRRAAGVKPVCCPPITIANFDAVEWMVPGNDLYYFKLHGLREQAFWYGDDWNTAMSAERLRTLDLRGGVVFVSNCWLMDSPMLEALRDAGADAIIGGNGENYASRNRIDGSDLLGYFLRMWMLAGAGVDVAFRMAKNMVKVRERFEPRERRKKAMKDALEFKIVTRKEESRV